MSDDVELPVYEGSDALTKLLGLFERRHRLRLTSREAALFHMMFDMIRDYERSRDAASS